MNRRTLRSKHMDVRKHRRLCYQTLKVVRDESRFCNYDNASSKAIPLIINILRNIK